jgi:hypothetical protein
MRKTSSRQIGERLFTLTQLPGWRGAKLFWQLSSVLLPALTSLGKGLSIAPEALLSKGVAGLDVDLGALLGNAGHASQMLFEKLPPDEFERIARELLETCSVQKAGVTVPLMPIFDEEMSGEMGSLLGLLAFALEVNFKDFLPGLADKAARAAKAASNLGASSISQVSGAVGVS